MQLCLAVVLGLGAFQVANGTLPVAQLVAFVMYVFLLLTPVGQAVRAMTSLSQATAAARRLAEVEEEAEAPEERSGRGKARATSVSGPTPVPEANDARAVEFADVHFAYPATGGGATAGEPKPALRGVTFAVPPGAKVGIVGPSGSGKSTILNLIAGFYSPQRGSVRIAGIAEASDPDVRDRGLIGLVEQDAPVIAGTLRDNLTLGDPEIGEAEETIPAEVTGDDVTIAFNASSTTCTVATEAASISNCRIRGRTCQAVRGSAWPSRAFCFEDGRSCFWTSPRPKWTATTNRSCGML